MADPESIAAVRKAKELGAKPIHGQITFPLYELIALPTGGATFGRRINFVAYIPDGDGLKEILLNG